MRNSVSKKWQQVLRDLHARFPGKVSHEIYTEDGVFKWGNSTKDDVVIEIIDDEGIEIEGVRSGEVLKSTIRGAVKETLSKATGKV